MGCGIDNVLIELHGKELPDSSTARRAPMCT
jgi:UDP-3-O-acyl-N-acetylglucosamine deacetylase